MMRNIVIALCLFTITYGFGQNITGGWEYNSTTKDNTPIVQRMTITDGYWVITHFEESTGQFVHTSGGSWTMKDDRRQQTVEFDSNDSDKVGTTLQWDITMTNDKLKVKQTGTTWERIDAGKEGALAGAWLMSGRIRDGQKQERDTNRPRKTMKILSGTLFQWIAYNTATKEFMATGGGRYTTIDGKYTEKIDFFSRDVSRVGAALEFDYNLQSNDWHHSGFSSKGQPLYEIWSPRQQ